MEPIKNIVNLSEGEQVVREYHAIEQSGILKKVDGKLALTNKRAIAYSKGRRVLGDYEQINETSLEGIEGTEIISGLSVSWGLLGIGIACAVIGIVMGIMMAIVGGGGFVLMGILALIVGIGLAILAFRREFGVKVKTAGTGQPIHYPLLFAGGPLIAKVRGPDADALMEGLGAMIMDIKLRGEKILEDQKCPDPECRYMRPFEEKSPKHCPECGTSWGE